MLAHASVHLDILVIRMKGVDQNALLTLIVRQIEFANKTNAKIRAQELAVATLSAKP